MQILHAAQVHMRMDKLVLLQSKQADLQFQNKTAEDWSQYM